MDVNEFREILRDSGPIVFFGGAGVSTESNIPDFRSADGIYNEAGGSRIPPEEILSHDFFMARTREFYEFYRSKMIYKDAVPNSAHLALARLEAEGKLKAVVTQNIDGLHQAAGSINVLELHGSVHRNHCMKCGKFFGLDDVLNSRDIPRCDSCHGIIKPDVVLYQENLDSTTLEKSIRAISEADMLIVGGTSLTVYPAAGLINYYHGKKLVLLNKTPTPYDRLANYIYYGKIAELFEKI